MVFGAVTLILFWSLRPGTAEGPIVHSRHLSAWVDLIGVSKSVRHLVEYDVAAAEEAVEDIGTNAFPYLLQWMQSETTPLVYKLSYPMYRFVAKYPAIERATMPRSYVRATGSEQAFLLLRTNLNPAIVDELTGLMNKATATNTAMRATTILGQIGPAGVPALAAVLTTLDIQ